MPAATTGDGPMASQFNDDRLTDGRPGDEPEELEGDGYTGKTIELSAVQQKPEGVSDADWTKKKIQQ
ncbi:MAG: hypothetical protein WKF37_10300 [Bryobacteraceae bacterium]